MLPVVMGFRLIIISTFLALSNSVSVTTSDTCKTCYYRDPALQNAYQVSTCGGCEQGKEGKGKIPLPYPTDSKVIPCNKTSTSSAGTCSNACTLPGGQCKSDGDCCAYPYVTKIYPKGKYSSTAEDFRKLSAKSGSKCIFGTCRVDACKEGVATCSKQKCYIQDPSVSEFNYFVYSMSTCGFCIPRVTGARKDASPIKGIQAKDGLILRDQGGKCVYCSVLNGKCIKDSDCCQPEYIGSIGQVYTSSTFQSVTHTFVVDKVKCAEGKCGFASCSKPVDSCTPGSGKPCCDSKAKCTDEEYKCSTKTQPPPNCPNKSNLISCVGYRLNIYCNCTSGATPEVCFSNGQCKPCTGLGKACKTSEDCCKYAAANYADVVRDTETCVGGICTKCLALGKADCNNYKCCYGTCKTKGTETGDQSNVISKCAL